MSSNVKKQDWVCARCGEVIEAWSKEILDLRVWAHNSRNHHGEKPVNCEAIVKKDYDTLYLTDSDLAFLKDCGVEVKVEAI